MNATTTKPSGSARTIHAIQRQRLYRSVLTATLCCAIACESTQQPGAPTVASAWNPPTASRSTPIPATSDDSNPSSSFAEPARSANSRSANADPEDPQRLLPAKPPPIAVVNGAAIEREPFISALLQAHGTALLEQFVALEVAKQATRRAGIVVSKADIQDEYNRSLDLLAGQSAPHSPETATNDEKLRRQAGESLLQQVLTARNLTREIYMLIMERNAHLRMLAAQTTEITPDDLRLQYNRMHGQRVQIRHIQVMKRSDLDAAIAEYENGADMATLAVKYSLNAASAERLGLLDPFTADDPDIPALLRKTAFDMNPGDPPKPVFADGWYHWFRVEKRIPASGIPLTSCRAVVEKALRDRLTDAEMQRLHAKLMREADIRVHEPALQSKFYERFGRSASEADTSK